MKIVLVFLTVLFASNAVVASAARCHVKNYLKTHTTSGKNASKRLALDDPASSDESKAVSCMSGHHTGSVSGAFVAMLFSGTAPVLFSSIGIVPIKASHPHTNRFSDIFIPPK